MGRYKRSIFSPPTCTDLFTTDAETQDKMDSLPLIQSPSVIEKSSVFTGFAFIVNNSTDIQLAYRRVKQLIPDSDHIIMAYAVKQHMGDHDNGEHAAGRRLSAILADRNLNNVAVFVSRVYGGIPLGPRRFWFIEKTAKEVLNLLT